MTNCSASLQWWAAWFGSREGNDVAARVHDTVLGMGPVPIDMVRATLLKKPLTRDYRASWDF